jgi:hypothetical protein
MAPWANSKTLSAWYARRSEYKARSLRRELPPLNRSCKSQSSEQSPQSLKTKCSCRRHFAWHNSAESSVLLFSYYKCHFLLGRLIFWTGIWASLERCCKNCCMENSQCCWSCECSQDCWSSCLKRGRLRATSKSIRHRLLPTINR